MLIHIDMENAFSQISDPMKLLAAADPETADRTRAMMKKAGLKPPSSMLGKMVNDVISGLSVDTALGRMVADGYVRMIAAGVNDQRINCYSRVIHRESGDNTTYASILAESLIDVLIWGDDTLIDDFFRAAALLKNKWLYALSPEPLNMVSAVIGPDDITAGKSWLGFLYDVFSHDLTYNQFRRFSSIFPKTVRSWPPDKRPWRIDQLRRVVRLDFNLACIFIDAINRELSLLAREGLASFVSEGLAQYRRDETRGAKFLGLFTRSAMEACHRLRTTGVLSANRRQLTSYLQARCGRPIPVRPISSISGILRKSLTGQPLVCFDGRTLYLADEISRFADHKSNDFLFKALAWFETGLYEFDTFDFDLEKITAEHPGNKFVNNADNNGSSDLERFFLAFPEHRIARDLFTVFEYGRVRTLLEEAYPGGARRYLPPIRREAEGLWRSAPEPDFMLFLFAGIALDDGNLRWEQDRDRAIAAGCIRDIFHSVTAAANRVEASADGVLQVLIEIDEDIFRPRGLYDPLTSPFGLQIRPELFSAAFAAYETQAVELKEKISRFSGETIHKSDIRKRLAEQGGALSADDIHRMICDARRRAGHSEDTVEKVDLLDKIDALYTDSGIQSPVIDSFAGETFRYPEWDRNVGDYLADHVLVRQREPICGDTDFYQTTLVRNEGLVRKIRYAFEMLKPEGISILRKWREGEDFDYRQLLEFAVDKKSGTTPSDRIYIKRLKQERDVAVLLLLDFSRSTSNNVAGSESTMVLDVEKEALVLFCEALKVTGDTFAIAGFSGTGRLGVDYFPVKTFDESITNEVERRIGIISPQRNTRMGAAIRHATSEFSSLSARTKLLIVISDGFPNDIDYKREYALADTRRSLLEARTRGIIVHSITINITGDSRLDDLYGRVRHSVISDVRQLPDRLIRIYGRLTG